MRTNKQAIVTIMTVFGITVRKRFKEHQYGVDKLMYLKILFCLLFPIFGLSGQERRHSEFACITKLPIPQYPILARSARRTGTVHVSVFTSTKGPVSVVTNPPSGLLAGAVRRALREAGYDVSCGPTTVELIFRFELVGPESEVNRDTVFFYPPNTFVVRNTLPMVEASRAKTP
jgi:hypothetical protein